MATRNPTSISKTAHDSLQAKLSAAETGWLHSNDVDSVPNPTVDSHPIYVYTKLLEQLHQGRKRRQSPLVNAGYAARMSTMTFILERWVYEVLKADNIRCINVVMVGCGMDALGIWSKHLLERRLSQFSNRSLVILNVYEFDCWDNCILKKESLIESDLLTADSTTDDERHVQHNVGYDNSQSYHVHLKGNINLAENAELTNRESDYTLVSLDLKEIHDTKSILTQAALKAGLDSAQPSIVLSELVLAYLGYDGANAVMRSISDVINGNRLSMFACVEPMFPTYDEQDNSLNMLSVEEAYARDYSRQFLGKLQTGNSAKSKPKSSWLHALGSNTSTIQQRLESCGLSTSYCTTLRNGTACIARILREVIGPKFMCAKEPFDEHAALALTLNCYCVVCSFNIHSTIDKSMQQNFRESVCPWSVPSTHDTTVSITTISTSTLDRGVNDLYANIYSHLYNEYPAIRKMVKSALKSDLSLMKDKPTSSIRDRFISESGDFWVALAKDLIVGCIGIKRRKSKHAESSTSEYEISRLAVHDAHRGSGIGKRLLQVAEEFSLSKGATEFQLYAVTPSCLLAANKLYESCGYSIDDSKCFMAGESLQMNVYCKFMK